MWWYAEYLIRRVWQFPIDICYDLILLGSKHTKLPPYLTKLNSSRGEGRKSRISIIIYEKAGLPLMGGFFCEMELLVHKRSGSKGLKANYGKFDELKTGKKAAVTLA